MSNPHEGAVGFYLARDENTNMPTMTIKEWAAEYQVFNDWKKQDQIARLPLETIEDSVRSYFALTEFVAKISGEPDENINLQNHRRVEYLERIGKWKRLKSEQQSAH
jgi:hypothetical protein